MRFFLSAFLLLLCASLSAQDPHSSFIGVAPSAYNPALTGLINGARSRVEVNSRHQWGTVTGRSDEFRTYMVNGETNLCLPSPRRCPTCGGDALSLGINVMSDRRGESPLYRLDANLAIAYRKVLNSNSNTTSLLSIGGKAGVISHSINFGDLTFNEQFDNPNLPPEISGTANTFVPDYSVGIAYSRAATKRMEAVSYDFGLSMLHLNRPDFSLLEEVVDERLGQTINTLYAAHFRASFPLNRFIAFNPSLVFRRQRPHQQLLLATDFMWMLNNNYLMFTGIGYRFSSGADQWRGDAFIANMGLLLGGQLEISFHFDAGTFVQQATPQALELRLGYRFGDSACNAVFCPNF